ncbi:MAG: hypothetical protein SFU86_09810 [Pirellulaceae bacterium]|nr:hypothetical protein [Pirellulaceae bacterium]
MYRLLAAGLAQLWRQFVPASGGESDHWKRQLSAIGLQLGRGRISQDQWQRQIGELYDRANLANLLQQLDFPAISAKFARDTTTGRPDRFATVGIGTNWQAPVRNSREPGRVPISKISHIQRGRSIPPHGHRSVVSAFLVISGEFQVRHYDKLAETPEHLLIRQASDERQRSGDWSSVTDERNNVHWLTALTDDCYLFTTKITRVTRGLPFAGRIHVDMTRALDQGNQTVAAPKISRELASEIY